jgi:hypothetical protein
VSHPHCRPRAGRVFQSIPDGVETNMNFEQNLFISFTHIDNQPLSDGDKGWITRFHATLKAMLSMRMGREAKIWRDEKLQGNDIFGDEIIARLKESAVLVSVVSSRYLKSEWCTREAREFCENAERNGGLTVGSKLRVFKIIKTPVDTLDPLPAPIKDVLGYEFFTYKDGAPLEFDEAYGQEYKQLYNQKVAKLAWELKQLIEELAGLAPPASGKPTIYLAECSYDRKQARDLIEGELKRLGYPVLPDTRLPGDEAEYVKAVEKMLAQCALSVHLVGESYGMVPDGPTDKSISMLQNELAVARHKSGGLRRLIWLPQETHSAQPQQQAFIDALHQNAEAQLGADLVAGEIEEFRAAIHVTLKKIEQPEPVQPAADPADEPAADGSSRLLYLICDEKDKKATVPLRKLCKAQGFEVELPEFEGDASQVRKANQQLLASCDAIIVFYGAGDKAWKRAIDGELKKMAGYRAGKPRPAIYTYLAPPRTGDKTDLIDMEEPGLIDGLDRPAEPSWQ